MASLRDALKSAFSAAGQEIPVKPVVKRLEKPAPPKNTLQQVQRGVNNRQQDRRQKSNRAFAPTISHPIAAHRRPIRPDPVVPVSIVSPTVRAPEPDCILKFGPNARYSLKSEAESKLALLSKVEAIGVAEQCHSGVVREQRELVMGLDFGTSSVKVVIGDAALDKSFLVPFLDGTGLGSYLLPSRLYESKQEFSLEQRDVCHRDLKLAFIANSSDTENQIRVVAFLAAVIVRARGWLFSEHRGAYKNTEIIWKVSVGLPAANSMSSDLAAKLKRLASIAWQCAAIPNSLTRTNIAHFLGANPIGDSGTVEIEVVPEIAAQIFGFVVSNSFDKKAANIYLMVDVGAGTVDSSLFRVKPAKGGKWDFEFFTTAVEPHGVMNLHRYRNAWWQDILKANGASQAMVEDVRRGWRDTDHLAPLPESFQDYFEDVCVDFRKGVKPPDQEFFESRVVTQVRGKTLWRAWKENFLNQQAIADLPLFLCGGGARMDFYLELENQLKQQHGFSWLKAEAWTMGVPGDLVAAGLADSDYDRVSVAYGLSRLDVGKVIRAAPIPKVEIEPVRNWTDNYVDKDQC